MRLKDGRKAKLMYETKDRYWVKVNGITSAYSKDGKWREDKIDSCADIDMKTITKQYKLL